MADQDRETLKELLQRLASKFVALFSFSSENKKR